MTEDERKEVAVFRFGVIAEFVGTTGLERGEKTALLKQKCARKWQIPQSRRTRLSKPTILRWIKRYEDDGCRLESLYPLQRSDKGKTRALDEETSLVLLDQRRMMPKISVPELIQTVTDRQLIAADVDLGQTTVYRLFHQHNLMQKETVPVDRRKFEVELPNDMWQSDVMHGPILQYDDKRRKSYLIAFIDDHSRLIPHAQFYPSEALAPFMEAFIAALRKRGLPRKLYVDNGAAFRAHQLEATTASLGIALIHAKPYQPQGKGKIERFFKTVRTQFLSTFEGETFDQINTAFDAWLEGRYHQRTHSATGQSPLQRFTSKMHCLRLAPENLTDHFRKTVRRRVNKDRTVVVDKRLFEAPVELISKRVEVLYHETDPERAEICLDGKSYGLLRLVDLHVNSRVKRDKNNQVELSGAGKPSSGQLWGNSQ